MAGNWLVPEKEEERHPQGQRLETWEEVGILAGTEDGAGWTQGAMAGGRTEEAVMGPGR